MVIERLSSTPRGNSLFSFGLGQLLVLVRRISDEDAGKRLASALVYMPFKGRSIIERFPSTQRGVPLFSLGRGQLLVLVRRISNEEATQLQAKICFLSFGDEWTIERFSNVVPSKELQYLVVVGRESYQPGFVCKLQRTELRSRDHRKCGA